MHRLRAYLLVDPAIVLSTIFFGSVSVVVSIFDRSGNTFIRIARTWARSLLCVGGVRVHVEGLDQLSPGGSYVLIANHVSYMDSPVILANIPIQFRFLAKKGLFQIPFLGTHLGQAGHIPVPRGDPRASVRTMQLAAEAIHAHKISLLIFPEGGRSHDGILQPFKEGAAYIAIRAGVPAVPVAIIGTRRILPFGSGVVVPGPVTLRVLPPIDTRELTLKDRGKLTEQVRALINNELDQASDSELAQKSSF